MEQSDNLSALAKLREPFAANHISKLPKPTKAQTEAVKGDFKKGVRCKDCGSWHHPDVIHLDYVGHAALTDRLLDTDPTWSWEPVSFRDGLPAFDGTGGLWIKLTVCGVTRLGYGHAAAKPGVDPGAREKEVIGDALRNAAMRFGAALDLWHKGDLHADEQGEAIPNSATTNDAPDRRPVPREKMDGPFETKTALKKAADDFIFDLRKCASEDELEYILGAPTTQTLKAQLVKYWPGYLNGKGFPTDFEPINKLVVRLREEMSGSVDEFAELTEQDLAA